MGIGERVNIFGDVWIPNLPNHKLATKPQDTEWINVKVSSIMMEDGVDGEPLGYKTM